MKNTYGYDVDVDSLILTKSIGDGNEYHPAFSLDDKMMENGVYKITFERDGAVDYWMRKDISVVIQTAQKPSTSETQTNFSLRSGMPTLALAGAPETEPTEETVAETIPVPGTIGNVVSIRAMQAAEQYGDFWVIPLEQDQQLVQFQWETSEQASEYFVYTLDEFGNPELITQTTENSIWLPVEDYEDGCITLYVGAVLEDGTVTWGEAMFELIPFFDEPIEEPEEPTEESTEPSEEPTEAPIEPTEEATEPTEPPIEPTEESTEPSEEPTEPPIEPTEESTEPTEVTTEPTEAPIEPTEAPTEPTQAPIEPPVETTSVEPVPEPATESIPEPVQESQAADEAA